MIADGRMQIGTDKKEYIYNDLTYEIIGAIYEVHKELAD